MVCSQGVLCSLSAVWCPLENARESGRWPLQRDLSSLASLSNSHSFFSYHCHADMISAYEMSISSSEQVISSCPDTHLDSRAAPEDLQKSLLSSLEAKCLCVGQEAERTAGVWGHSWVTPHSAVARLQFSWVLDRYLLSCCTNSSLSQAESFSLSLPLVSLIQISFKFPCISFYRFPFMNQSCPFVFKENAVCYKLWILFQICLQSFQTVTVAFSKLFQAPGNIWLSVALGW